MALYRFTRALLTDQPIPLYNAGKMSRDFTFVEDVVEALLRLQNCPPVPDSERLPSSPDQSPAPFRICNVGNHQPVSLLHLIQLLEKASGRTAKIEFLPMQPGDVLQTFADSQSLSTLTGFAPHTSMEDGIIQYLAWFREYYRL
jgi:UDP-glucuronate 4-epimerase